MPIKSGIFIRIGTENIDIVDLLNEEFKEWWETLSEDAKYRTVRILIQELDYWYWKADP